MIMVYFNDPISDYAQSCFVFFKEIDPDFDPVAI